MKKRVLIISFSPIATDPRVMRQIQSIESRFDLTVAGFGAKPCGNFTFYDVGAAPSHVFNKLIKALLLLFGLNEWYYWRMSFVRNSLKALQGQHFDLVIANDVNTVAVALRIADGAPVLLDAHEYSPREFEDLWRWRLFFQGFYTYLCQRYLPQIAGMTTVCEGIAQEYRQFGVNPVVVSNCPLAQDLPARKVNPQQIRLVHHGVSIPSRRLELMLEMMKYLDHRYTLDLMLVESNPAYMRHLRSLASMDSRIRFRDPVPMQEIPCSINDCDIGLFLLPPVNFNYAMALPNKFFEFVQARLAVAIGPSPEMARIAEQYGFGIISDSFEPRELAARIASLSASDIDALKLKADVAAHELNAARNAEIFTAQVDSMDFPHYSRQTQASN
jgi:Glycosyltransferase Family 4